jgi:hypothetical protein
MDELLLTFVFTIGVLQGFTIGFILWAPSSNFKQGFLDGISLKFLWKRK